MGAEEAGPGCGGARSQRADAEVDEVLEELAGVRAAHAGVSAEAYGEDDDLLLEFASEVRRR